MTKRLSTSLMDHSSPQGWLCAWLSIVLLLSVSVSGAGESAAGAPEASIDWAQEQNFWSFRSPVAQPWPAVKAKRWPRQPVDYFVLSRLEQAGLSPSAQTSRRSLLRRVTFDLTGLPPTSEEVFAFLADQEPGAYDRVVERLLRSPRFGERMASLWLPLARYAEDQAHQVGDDTKYFYPNAWRYREWVVDALNRDLPYDQFLKLQLAADRIEGTNSPNLAALGFLGLGPKYYDRDRLAVQADEWEDRIDTVSRTMLGLTVACARCHDHKFDPITTRDYYGLAGVFASTRMINRRPDGSLEKGDAKGTNFSAATLHLVMDADQPQDLPVFIRGNVDQKGPVAERGFLRVLSRPDAAPFRDGSGRRELADRIACRENPLVARVMVNRVWGALFGQPLVATPSNFGHAGMPPSHPELLDDLAVRFMAANWSVKALVRELVLSATYGQQSGVTGRSSASRRPTSASSPRDASIAASGDPANILLGRMNRKRLSIEQWRDSVLFVTGELTSGGGKSLELDDPKNLRRTLYARVSRLKLNDLFMQFDYPDANVHAEKRSTTTTAMQKLFVLNSAFMQTRAQALSQRVLGDRSASVETSIQRAYQLLFGRDPSREERSLAVEFLRKPPQGETSRWDQYAQLLLASNEMNYVD
ncbi:MAG: DUF1549 domain-containing protein [Verrucomicrobiales bacterium]|nr:DUF1549 domain-containing protein [Verrucomicrobiales bacterium]